MLFPISANTTGIPNSGEEVPILPGTISMAVLLLVLQAKEVAEQTLGSGLNSVELMQFKATLR